MEVSQGVKPNLILRHLHGLFHQQSQAKYWRQGINQICRSPHHEVINHLLTLVNNMIED